MQNIKETKQIEEEYECLRLSRMSTAAIALWFSLLWVLVHGDQNNERSTVKNEETALAFTGSLNGNRWFCSHFYGLLPFGPSSL